MGLFLNLTFFLMPLLVDFGLWSGALLHFNTQVSSEHKSLGISGTFRQWTNNILVFGFLGLGWISSCNNLMGGMLGHLGQFLRDSGTFGEFRRFRAFGLSLGFLAS